MDIKIVKKRVRRSNQRIKCEFCDKDYATKEGIMKHTVSAHHRRYDRKTGEALELTPGELSEEITKVRRAQYRGKSPATFNPSGAPERQFRGKKARPTELPEETDSVESIEFQPEPESESVILSHLAGQPGTSRSLERAPRTADDSSVCTEDVDVDLLNSTLVLDTVSVVSVPPFRTSTPSSQPLGNTSPVVPPHSESSDQVATTSTQTDHTGVLSSGVTYNPQRIYAWAGGVLSLHPQASVQAFCETLVERRPPWLTDEQLDRSMATFRDFESGHRQALSQVHDLLRAADLSSTASILMAVATIANFTQQSLSRPYEDPVIPVDTQSAPVAYDNISSDSEGALVIDLPSEEDSDPSQYSDDSNATVAYAE